MDEAQNVLLMVLIPNNQTRVWFHPCQKEEDRQMRFQNLLIAISLSLCLVNEALADTFILVTGRRDPRMYAIDLQKALRPENDKTPNAIVSRSKVTLDRLDGRPLGDSANVVISEDGKTAYVVNHHGSIDNAEFLQHRGHERQEDGHAPARQHRRRLGAAHRQWPLRVRRAGAVSRPVHHLGTSASEPPKRKQLAWKMVSGLFRKVDRVIS
jgi:hypothetical protein